MNNLKPGILINIDPKHSAKLQTWVNEIDWQIIANQFETRSAVLVLDKKSTLGGFSLTRLTEIPEEKDRYRPHYGDFGGGFSYSFRDHPDGTYLLAQSTARPVHRKNLVPLALILPSKIKTALVAEGYGVISAGDSQFEAGENQFGFYGDIFQRFHAWAWYSEDIEPFEFRFYPGSVGCMVEAVHLPTENLIDLTKDVMW